MSEDMSKYVKVFLVFFLLAACASEAALVRRAAFDFGSGKVKVQVADVDTEAHKIAAPIFYGDIVVPLSEDAAHRMDGTFSQEIQDRAVEAAQALKEKAQQFGATEFRGLATEAYRKAPNGQDLADRYRIELKIPVQIISQAEEGKSGFFALVAETNLDPANVIAWDIGGGSFQITYLDEENNVQVYMAPFGRETAKNAIIKHVKGQDPSKILSPNPMNGEEWEASLKYFNEVLPAIPPVLAAKLKKADVRLIGMSAHPEELRNRSTYHMRDVKEVLKERLNKNDNELAKNHKAPNTAASELVLVYSVMQKLSIQTVEYIRTHSGSSSALLIEEEHWAKPGQG